MANKSKPHLVALAKASIRMMEKYDQENWYQVAKNFLQNVPIEEFDLDINEGDLRTLQLTPSLDQTTQHFIIQYQKTILNEKMRRISESIQRITGEEDPELIENEVLYNFLPNAFYIKDSGWSDYLRFQFNGLNSSTKIKLPRGSGLCYVLGDVNNSDVSKIGFTTRSASKRAREYGAEHSLSFYVYDVVYSSDAAAVEKLVHKELHPSKIEHPKAKEIFAITPEVAVKYVRKWSGQAKDQLKMMEARELAKQKILLEVQLNKLMKDNTYLLNKIEKQFITKVLNAKTSLSHRVPARFIRRYGWQGKLKLKLRKIF